MALFYQENGNLRPGIYEMTWLEFCDEFAFNTERQKLILGLEKAIVAFKDVGCSSLYIGGSFASKKNRPNDIDACWDPIGVDMTKMYDKYPLLFKFPPSTKKQKEVYGGEYYPSPLFLNFFQTDRDGVSRGLIKLLI